VVGAGREIRFDTTDASVVRAVLQRFGITAEAVVKAAKDSIKAAQAAVHAPAITETNPRKRDSSGDTDVKSSMPRAAAKKSATAHTSKRK